MTKKEIVAKYAEKKYKEFICSVLSITSLSWVACFAMSFIAFTKGYGLNNEMAIDIACKAALYFVAVPSVFTVGILFNETQKDIKEYRKNLK